MVNGCVVMVEVTYSDALVSSLVVEFVLVVDTDSVNVNSVDVIENIDESLVNDAIDVSVDDNCSAVVDIVFSLVVDGNVVVVSFTSD